MIGGDTVNKTNLQPSYAGVRFTFQVSYLGGICQLCMRDTFLSMLMYLSEGYIYQLLLQLVSPTPVEDQVIKMPVLIEKMHALWSKLGRTGQPGPVQVIYIPLTESTAGNQGVSDSFYTKQQEEGGGTSDSFYTKQQEEDGGTSDSFYTKQQEEGGGTSDSFYTKQQEEGGGTSDSFYTKQQEEGGGTSDSFYTKQQEERGGTTLISVYNGKVAGWHSKGGNHLKQDSTWQTSMEGIDGGLHLAMDEQSESDVKWSEVQLQAKQTALPTGSAGGRGFCTR